MSTSYDLFYRFSLLPCILPLSQVASSASSLHKTAGQSRIRWCETIEEVGGGEEGEGRVWRGGARGEGGGKDV